MGLVYSHLKVPNTLSLFKGIKTQTGDSLHTTR